MGRKLAPRRRVRRDATAAKRKRKYYEANKAAAIARAVEWNREHKHLVNERQRLAYWRRKAGKWGPLLIPMYDDSITTRHAKT